MDPTDAFSTSMFRWDPRAGMPPPNRLFEAVAATVLPPLPPMQPMTSPYYANNAVRPREVMGLEDLFQPFGIRYYTASKIAELGFTMSTLLDMRDVELDEMMDSLSHIFRWELLVGERYGIKAAVRAERRRIDEEDSRPRRLLSCDTTHVLDALSQEGLSEEPVQQENEAAGSGGGGRWQIVPPGGSCFNGGGGKKQRMTKKSSTNKMIESMEDDDEIGGDEDDNNNMMICGVERQREHPFIVTEPGEVARGKKNGLDYLFHLYEQCREFLIQVQNIAKERGEKCPTKVTNEVFRYAKKAGASYINKPKMRHYVHCYALHCLDEEVSNAMRSAFKERGENVGAWRLACYKPLVAIAARQGWDVDAIFNAHPRLTIWYVPTKLRQLCHAERSAAVSTF
ncbi:hypothetical protein Leryth_024191 [Lithospermum erythrorhizon]|nr:hypothetical protein Leryth_024191 [Lithospermum erythrorhizon]